MPFVASNVGESVEFVDLAAVEDRSLLSIAGMEYGQGPAGGTSPLGYRG